MNSYDAICIFDPRIKEEKLGAILSKFEKVIKEGGGEVEKMDKWGLKKLAFTFKKTKGLKEGYYILINFKGSAKITLELQNILRVTEDVIRFIITRATAKELEAFQAPEEKVEIAESMLIKPSEKKEG